MKKDALYFLQKLISFRTVSHDEAANREALAWIREELKDYPLYVHEHTYNNHPSLILTTQPTKDMDIMLQGHLDVVEGSETIFQPKIEGDMLIGRGSFDMKFAIAAYMELVTELKDSLSNYNFGIVINTDEEIGGFNGIPKILEEGYSAHCAVLPDGGEDWIFQEGAKGVYQLELVSRGISSHGARPWLGKSAIETLIFCIETLKDLFQSEPCGKTDHLHSTMTIGKISGGKSTNQVANEATAHLDIRFMPPETLDSIRKQVQNSISKYPDVTIRELATGNSYVVDKTNPYVSSFVAIAKKELLIDEEYLFSHGSSDARFLIDKGVPTILVRPIGGHIHSENEWISIASLHDFYTVLKKFIESSVEK